MANILIAEDGILNAMYGNYNQIKSEVTIFTAETNEDALKIAMRHPLDAILYDIGLGEGVTGYDFPTIERLRKIRPQAVIFGTTFNPLEYYEEYKEHFDGLISSMDILRGNIKLNELLRDNCGIVIERK